MKKEGAGILPCRGMGCPQRTLMGGRWDREGMILVKSGGLSPPYYEETR
ncbi:MAG: hypothetical protein HQ553_04505 [Chloroflexi bacterium]|nr:hypothetical protein [Chloroflexota bacterium]